MRRRRPGGPLGHAHEPLALEHDQDEVAWSPTTGAFVPTISADANEDGAGGFSAASSVTIAVDGGTATITVGADAPVTATRLEAGGTGGGGGG